jgi:N-methylhydantoinase A
MVRASRSTCIDRDRRTLPRRKVIEKSLRIAIDIGGTFTDLAAFDGDGNVLRFGKALSTHDSLITGMRETLEIAAVDVARVYLFLHGSTIAINTLLERTGAETALVVTEGFRDVYEIGRINRPDAYNLFFGKHRPLVPRSSTFELPERVLADGSIECAIDDGTIRELATRLRQRKFAAVGIMLLHSYRNAAHERRVQDILCEELPDVFVTSSHELTQEYREFERTSTVAANAYVGPRVNAYLLEMARELERDGFRGDILVVQSTGGLFPVADARRGCVRMLESGPAAGVSGARAVCRQIGIDDAIAFDMGGTTAKAGVISDGKIMTTGSALIGGYERALPIQIPMIDIFEVGTGGGSIARVGAGGALRVGPDSAGSKPGPACYGAGGMMPTVTDANLVLGRLDPANFLGGTLRLHPEAAMAAVRSHIALPLGMDPVRAADGILQIAVTAMSHAVKAVTTERGLDAGAFRMIVFGGAGPLHGVAIARELGLGRILVPFSPGHFSAFGMLFSDLRHDYVRSVFEPLAACSWSRIDALFDEMESMGRAAIASSSSPPERIVTERAADMRYVGQEHAVTVDLPAKLFAERDRSGIKAAFDTVHRQRYGTSAPAEPAELVSLRATVLGELAKPPWTEIPTAASSDPGVAQRGERPVFFRERGGFVDTAVYDRARLRSGHRIVGPALIEEHASTTVLAPGDSLVVDRFGNLDIVIGALA